LLSIEVRELDDLIDQAVEQTEHAITRDPRDAPYGIILSSLAMGAYAQRHVMWFESLDDVCDYLIHFFPALFCGAEEPDELSDIVEPIVEEIRTSGFTFELMDELNLSTLSWIHMEWWGSFESLCEGDSDASRQLISWFKGDEAGEEDDSEHPISSEEIDGFVEFLAGLGGA
jgi:hypothetical protein